MRRKKLYKNQKRSEETDSERQIRLKKERLSEKQKQSKQAENQRAPKRVSQHKISQQEYLNIFDIAENGGIEQQSWVKANINKFHKSVQYAISQCTVCKQAWPLKSKPTLPCVFLMC